MNTNEELIEKIKCLADEAWAEDQRPLYLSNLPFRISVKYPEFDYKSVLGSDSLKQFILNTEESGGYKLITHPSQWAKVAVAPKWVDYQFPESLKCVDSELKTYDSDGEKKVITLLKTLGNLSEDDLDKVNIPISILVNMVK